MFDHIEMFYNPKRKHARSGMLSPVDFERQQKLKHQGVDEVRVYSHKEERRISKTAKKPKKELRLPFQPLLDSSPTSAASMHPIELCVLDDLHDSLARLRQG